MPMATARDWFDFYYPQFTTQGHRYYTESAMIETALSLAITYAPNCLAITPEQTLQAIAHYAAYELALRADNLQKGSSVTIGSVLTKEREGDVERTYSAPKVENLSSQTNDDSPYMRWQRLAVLCPSPFTGFSLRSRRI